MTGIVAAFALTAGMVAQVTGGRLTGAPDLVLAAVSTDSRTIGVGALFIALRGDRFDGHDFVTAALDRGAGALLVSTTPADARHAAVILVADTLDALQALGRHVRRVSGARVIAITGSAGKTTTKEVAAELLASRYRVFRNPGNLNNHIGLPLSLLELRHGPDVAVVELGMNHAGEIRTLVGIAEPDVRVWINVGDAHIGYFDTRESIASAKAEILEGATPQTVVVANADDPLVMSHASKSLARLVTFGESGNATVRATDVTDRGFDGTTAHVQTPAGRLRLSVPLAGRPQLMNVLAAVGVALEFDVALDAIESRVAALRPVARRGAITTRPDGVRVIDDSYNASPAAMEAMLASLSATATAGRRIAVVGEMLELGARARDLHEASGRAAARARVDLLIVVGGPAADGVVDGAVTGGLASDRVRRFADSTSARDAVAALVRQGDLVLVKGSRGTRTDLIADRLTSGGGA